MDQVRLFFEVTEVNNESKREAFLQVMDQFIHVFVTRKIEFLSKKRLRLST